MPGVIGGGANKRPDLFLVAYEEHPHGPLGREGGARGGLCQNLFFDRTGLAAEAFEKLFTCCVVGLRLPL